MRTMGIALFAISALMAVAGAGSASASGFVSELSSEGKSTAYNAEPTSTFYIKIGITTIVCSGTALNASAATSVEELPLGGTTAGTCGGSQIEMKGCKFILHPGTSGAGSGTIEIGPAGCGPITIPKSTCGKITIGPQKGLTANYTNEGTGKTAAIAVNLAAPTFEYSLYSPFLCGEEGVHTNGTLNAQWKLKAFVNSGLTEQRGARIATDSYSVEGFASEEAAYQPHFTATEYPAWVHGEQSKTVQFTTPYTGNAKCKTLTHSGEALAQSSELSLAAVGSECSLIGGTAANLNLNSCHFVLHVANAGPPYTGSEDIVCTTSGDAIKFVANSGTCTLSFPAQTVAAVSYSTLGGPPKTVEAKLTGSSLTYTTAGVCAGGPEGTFSNGSLSGSLLLKALQK